MDSLFSRKRPLESISTSPPTVFTTEDDESTEFKLALLASLYSTSDTDALLETLLAAEGSVDVAAESLSGAGGLSPRKKRAIAGSTGYQSSLQTFQLGEDDTIQPKALTRKGKTLHLYCPEDIAQHTPCSIIHNFLPTDMANALLKELLEEATTFGKETFNVFGRTVTSPHTMAFYVDEWDEIERQKTEYVYNGSQIQDIRKTPKQMLSVSIFVRDTVNKAIQKRIQSHYPGQKKLKYQSPGEWIPNTAFVNCYDGGQESVGYHSDQLTYLGPRAVIGSLSLGVSREFRIRKVVSRSNNDPGDGAAKKGDEARADTEGQIAIHLPHNSLLVMHAEMQEEWKHSIAPAQAIDPHPLAKNKRINVTYRCYRKSLHPRYTPRCHCNCPTVLRCVQKKEENRGKYMWMCHAGYTPGQKGCAFFQWAEFDDDGEPIFKS